jgi:uncharacterized membrane protein
MNRKTISIISYLTIIGWLISFVYYNLKGKSTLAQYHLKQSFGLGLLGLFICILYFNLTDLMPFIFLAFILISIGIFATIVAGIVNAAKEKKMPVPVVGYLFCNAFSFIKYY